MSIAPCRPCAALWIASFPDGAHKPGKREELRITRDLRPSPFLIRKLGGIDQVKSLLSSLGTHHGNAPDFHVHSLVKISDWQCSSCHGPLTPWGDEVRELWHYYGYPSDSYSVFIEEVYNLATPRILSSKLSRRQGAGGYTNKLSPSQPFMIAEWSVGSPITCGIERLCGLQSGEDSVATVLSSLRIPTEAENIPVLLLPYPIVKLVKEKEWQRLMLCIRWHPYIHPTLNRKHNSGPLELWPPADGLAWSRVGCSEDRLGEVKFSQDSLEDMLKILRDMGPSLEPYIQGQEDATRLGKVVESLQQWSNNLDPNAQLSDRKRLNMYDSQVLIDCLRLTTSLKGGGAALA